MNDGVFRFPQAENMHGFTTFSCMKFFVLFGLFFKITFIFFNLIVLVLTWDEKLRVPLRIFISIYTFLMTIQGLLFFLKHKDFFFSNRIPDFTENNNINFFRSLVGAFTLFWYLTGLHWLQDCYTCSVTNKLMYYTSCFIVYLGLVKMLAPLVALVLLVIIVSYLSPTIPEIDYDRRKMTEEESKCSICLEKYNENTKLKILPCNHHFHSTCIDDWFEIEEICPLCMKHLNPFHEILDQTPI